MEIPFIYYLHGESPFTEYLDYEVHLGPYYSSELLLKMGNPFYEVSLNCTVNTETGEVTLVSACL